ncbi:MAG: deoxyribose-phosphate aldolase [Actinobacteria bacterium]|nr:deoxyribose-phosphate aldolase [Actinomycetota bacterium]
MSPAARRHATTLAGRIDHTLLDPTATQARVEQLCAEALQYNFAAVCVNSRWVLLVTDLLAESDVLVCTVVGFPLGAMSPQAKASEAAIAVAQGAQEIDMVIDIGSLIAGENDAVYADIAGVVIASEPMPVKVIIETCLLTDEQKVTACRLAMRAGAAYVKTSTGFSTGGATVEDVRLMRDTVGDELGVKASGGIRSLATAEAMLEAGADRLGTSSGMKIVSEASSR